MRAAAGLVAALLASGCAEPGDREAAPARQEASLADSARPYRSPDGFAPPFRTVVPAEVRPEVVTLDDEDGIRFAAYPGGTRSDSAYLYVFVTPPGTGEQAARETVHAIAERVRVPGDRTELEPVRRRPWAVAEYTIRSRGSVHEPLRGWVALGRHAGRWFHVVVQYPEGLEEWFAPRADRILDAWRWTDTGAPLGGE